LWPVSSAGGMGRGPGALCLRGEWAPSSVRVRAVSAPRSSTLSGTGKPRPGSLRLPAPLPKRNSVVAVSRRSRRRSAIAPPQSSASTTRINTSVMSSRVEGGPGSDPDPSGSWRAGFGRAEGSTVPRVKPGRLKVFTPTTPLLPGCSLLWKLRASTSPTGTCQARGSALTTGAPASCIDTLSRAAISPLAASPNSLHSSSRDLSRALNGPRG
jgi:hypothetical protein